MGTTTIPKQRANVFIARSPARLPRYRSTWPCVHARAARSCSLNGSRVSTKIRHGVSARSFAARRPASNSTRPPVIVAGAQSRNRRAVDLDLEHSIK